MPDTCREIAAELNRNKKNRTFGELKAILESCGFVEHARRGGSHRAFTKAGCGRSVLLVKSSPMLAAYVRNVVVGLEECCDD